ncbi:FAD-binding-3 domain-containing protein [Fusarium falciforme]|uniref:FAD-binding-3 domain-containing protein n=1 Tax=Fusarium falciforme TaxID=195108 RepID=UPI00230093B0|nr:FAD-binding-3 domain-containing protein [Fusarium falciforme]WAO88307.1 FAD-binding-3 domain-containing protein [Fusarium falciforme]
MTTQNGILDHLLFTEDNSAPACHRGPLRVAIIGAGIGGLSAAIGLRRQGHQVDLYEKSSFAVELGAGIHLTPNGNGILRRWGIFAEEFGGTLLNRRFEFHYNGELILDENLATPNLRWEHPWHLVHRVALHERLKRAATGEDGRGLPAILHTSSEVVHVSPERGKITLVDGTIIEADVIIGADGVHSRSRRFICDSMPGVISSGKGAFRFLIPRSLADEDPETQPLVEARDAAYMWFANDRRVVLYPCNSNKTLNFVCIHPEEESHSMAGDGWDKTGSLEQVLEVFKSFDPVLLRLFRKMDPKELKVWQLLDMEKPPAWVNERMALLGDAAHPFTPYQGQGANQAIEDAATIMVVLPYGTCPADVPERLKIVIPGKRARTGKMESPKSTASVPFSKREVMLAYRMQAAIFGSFNFAHDAYHHANIVFKRHLWKSTPGARWRMPVSFGPSYELRSHDSSDSRQTFTTAAVRFKSSRTYLESLLPTESYTFVADDTLCEVSLAITTRKNVPCLGGADYSRFGLYLHGVQYKRDDGSTVQGSFVPVLLEDSADMVISTREEQGMPALFCDIEVTSSPQTYQMKASWRGVNFTDLILEDLEEDPRAAETAGDDVSGRVLLSHHLRPKIGVPEEPGETCAIKGSIGDASCRVTQRWRIKKGSVKLQGHSWESLPTLHHVAASLADMAMYGIVSAEVVSGTGVPDKRKYSRI